MAYRYMQNKSENELNHKEALTILQAVESNTFTADLSSLPPVDYHSGDVYVIRLKSPHDEDWKADERGWRHSGKYCSHGVKKVYYRVILGQWDDVSKEFKRNVYTLTHPSNTAQPGLIIHYTGNDNLGGQRKKHGNVKHHERPYIPMVRSTREGIRAQVKEGVRPQEAYEQSKQRVEAAVHAEQGDVDVLERILGPRNLKCAQNLKYSEDEAKRMSLDDTYNLTLLYHTGFQKFIRVFQPVPGVVVIFGHDNAIDLANRLLYVSHKDQSLEQMMSYDTTFDVGDYYMSMLVMRNTELVNDPIFPVLFMLHQKRPEKVHDMFWRGYVTELLKIKQYGRNLPIASDRERAIMNAIDANTDGNHVICHNHIYTDVKNWLRDNKGKQGDFRGYRDHIKRLLACKTTDAFDVLYSDLKRSWSQEFVKYADNHLHDDMRTYAIAAVTSRFAAFNTKSPTNNISESMNKMVKEKNHWKELPVDAAVLSMFMMQNAISHEFNRGYNDLGNYHCKEAVRNVPDLRLQDVQFIPLQDIVQRVKNELRERNIPLLKRPGYSMSSVALAQLCVNSNLVSYERVSKTHIVRNPFADEHHVVKLGETITCSCKCANCYHVKAVELLTGADLVPRKARRAMLSELTKSRKAEGKSGRRRPRKEDVVVCPAPDSELMTSKSKRPRFAQSTPQHMPATSTGSVSPFYGFSSVESQSFEIMYISDSDVSSVSEQASESVEACGTEQAAESVEACGSDHESEDYSVSENDIIVHSKFKPTDEHAPQLAFSGEHECLKPGAEITNFVLDDFTRNLVQKVGMESIISAIPCTVFQLFQAGQYADAIHHMHRNESLKKDALYVVMPAGPGQGNHWMAGVVNFQNHEVYILDSLSYDRYAQEICKSLARLIVACYALAKLPCNVDHWQFIYSTDCPKQNNSFDCGLYAGGFYLGGILLRKRTKLYDNDLYRRWMYNLLKTHEYRSPEKGRMPKESLNAVLQQVKNADVSNIVVIREPTEDKTRSLLSRYDRDWTFCNYGVRTRACPGYGPDDDDQDLCVKCRKWLHTKCDNYTDETVDYYICNTCKRTKST